MRRIPLSEITLYRGDEAIDLSLVHATLVVSRSGYLEAWNVSGAMRNVHVEPGTYQAVMTAQGGDVYRGEVIVSDVVVGRPTTRFSMASGSGGLKRD